MNIFDVTAENAQQTVIDESFKRLVVVQFWSARSPACQTLMPVLEKFAAEYTDNMLLAKINVDEQQMLVQQFGIQGLPTVMIIKDGQPVDGFAGEQQEPQIRELLEKYLPKAWEADVAQAQAFLDEANYAEALPLLRQALEESNQLPFIAVLLGLCYAEMNRVEEAEALLAQVKMADQDASYQQAMAVLELKKQAANSPELEKLQAEYEANPSNLEAAYALAVQMNEEGQHKNALELLLDVFKRDRNFKDGAPRKAITDIIAALGKGDPLAVQYQRKLFTLLY
ncbi:co-chaperone YbbN [Gilvimarinus agarilyticus]|uniref:thioredoxin family protein n=1 Tax=Gilvimarinus sp. 2_MG-2023 TaxID=3062666 RepID=UPI001C09CA93|nr:co-chaperone YbbN [Gilvimarinus sp. 2_MG-2023]MBU2886013.1 co-chaperone YbbN [Gilvimarinus agarilyticus]MDO6570759.1 co-chaperone YbbN [Gilvimarinus sp. 2_MG-2023]